MSTMNLGSLLVAALANYGPQVLALAALLGALGLPLPTPLVLLAAGALVRLGVLDPGWCLLAWTAGCMLGEGVFYLAGRYGGPVLGTRAGRLVSGTLTGAQERFRRQPALTVFVTRFLLTPLSIPTSLLAGSSRYGYRRFLASAIPGDVMWPLLYGIPGYSLGANWGLASQWLAQYGTWLAVAPMALMAAGYMLKAARGATVGSLRPSLRASPGWTSRPRVV